MHDYWYPAYLDAARDGFPEVCDGHDLAVGFKLVRKDGTTYGGYHWPLVNGDHDVPVLHEATAWHASNTGSCPSREGDGLCVATRLDKASSGGISVRDGVLHVVVYPADLACADVEHKWRVPWVIDVDCADPETLVRTGLVKDLRGANLWYANLWGADLRYANLWGADLRYADLRYADLRDAKHDKGTRWPAGFTPPSGGVG